MTVLAPLTDVAQAGEVVICVWYNPNSFGTTANSVAAIQAALVGDTDILPIGTVQSFVDAVGGVWTGGAFKVTQQADGTLYDDLLSGDPTIPTPNLYLIPENVTDRIANQGDVLVFVDYGDGLSDAVQAAQTCAAAVSGSVLGSPLQPVDSVGAPTPYAQEYFGAVSAIPGTAPVPTSANAITAPISQATNLAVGAAANTAENVANTAKNATAAIVGIVIAAIVVVVAVQAFAPSVAKEVASSVA
jgi:hypothetical protein